MIKFRWDLIGIYGCIAGILFAVIAVIRAGGPQSIYIATALVAVFGGMGLLFYKFYGDQGPISADCKRLAFRAEQKF